MKERPPKLSVLARRLLSAIRDIGKALQDQKEAITKAATEATKAANVKQSIPPLVRAEVNLPESIEVRKSTADANDDKKYQRWTLCVAWISIIISSLTLVSLIVYATISAYQLREMRKATRQVVRQIDDFEKAQSARLVVKEHTADLGLVTTDVQTITHITGSITIKNAGGSVANDINVEERGCGWSRTNPEGAVEIEANPKPGDGLAPQDTKTYLFDCGQMGTRTETGVELFYWHMVFISYRNIWGQSDVKPTCIVFWPKKPRGWRPCDFTYKGEK